MHHTPLTRNKYKTTLIFVLFHFLFHKVIFVQIKVTEHHCDAPVLVQCAVIRWIFVLTLTNMKINPRQIDASSACDQKRSIKQICAVHEESSSILMPMCRWMRVKCSECLWDRISRAPVPPLHALYKIRGLHGFKEELLLDTGKCHR